MKCKQFLKSCSKSAFSDQRGESIFSWRGNAAVFTPGAVCSQCLPRAGCGEEFRVCVEEALWFQELQGISSLGCVSVSPRQGAAVGLGLGKVDKTQIFNSGGPNLQLCRILPMWWLCSAFWEDSPGLILRFPPPKPCTLCSQSREQSSGWESPTGKQRNP